MAIQFSTARRAPARAEVVAHGLTTDALTGDAPLPAGLQLAEQANPQRFAAVLGRYHVPEGSSDLGL